MAKKPRGKTKSQVKSRGKAARPARVKSARLKQTEAAIARIKAQRVKLKEVEKQLRKTAREIAKADAKGGTRDIKKLRTFLAELKRSGKIKTKKRASSLTLKDKSLVKKLDVLADVSLGRKKTVKVSPKEAAQFRKTGHEVIGNEVVFPSEKGTRIINQKGKVVKIRKLKNGEIRSVVLPVPFHNLEQWLSDIANDDTLNQLKPPGAQFAFRFFGNHSYGTFHNLEAVARNLSHYPVVYDAIEKNNRRDQRQIYQNIEIVMVTSRDRKGFVTKRQHYKQRLSRRNRERRNFRQHLFLERMKKQRPNEYKQYVERKLAQQRARYKKNKRSKNAAYQKKLAASRAQVARGYFRSK